MARSKFAEKTTPCCQERFTHVERMKHTRGICEWNFAVDVNDDDQTWDVYFDWMGEDRRFYAVRRADALDEVAAMQFVLDDRDGCLDASDLIGSVGD